MQKCRGAQVERWRVERCRYGADMLQVQICWRCRCANVVAMMASLEEDDEEEEEEEEET